MTETPRPKALAQRPVFWLAIVAAVMLGIVAVAAGAAVGSAGSAAPAATAEPAAARPAPSANTPVVVVPAPVDEAPASIIPAECSLIYGTDWAAELGPVLVLNPAWTDDAQSGVRYGTDDAGLATVLEATAVRTCVWAQENGGGGVGLTTNVASVTAEQQESVLAQMADIGYDCFEELGGRRCIVEGEDDAGSWGESHFAREGVWVATKWVNTAPDGYTHDIVNTLWR